MPRRQLEVYIPKEDLNRIELLRKKVAAKNSRVFQEFARRISSLKDAARIKLIQLDARKSELTKRTAPTHITVPLATAKKRMAALAKKNKKNRKEEGELAFLKERIPQLEKLIEKYKQGEPKRKEAKKMELDKIKKEQHRIAGLIRRLIAADNVIKAEQDRRTPRRWV